MFLSKRYLPACLILILAFSSCHLQKRRYLSGYFVEWNAKKGEPQHNRTSADKRLISASAGTETGNMLVETRSLTEPVDCDTLVFKDGKVLPVRTLIKRPDEILYRLCDAENHTLYTVAKEKIELIKYQNGTEERMIVEEKKKKVVESEEITVYKAKDANDELPKRKMHRAAIMAFLLDIAGVLLLVSVGFVGFVLILSGVIFGLIAIRQINKNTRQYKGKWLAGIGIIFFLLVIMLYSLVGTLFFGFIFILFGLAALLCLILLILAILKDPIPQKE